MNDKFISCEHYIYSMNIESIASTKERIKILNNIMYRSDILSVNSIAKSTNLSKGLVSKYFDLLKKEGILKKKNGKFLVNNTVQAKAIKILLNLNNFDVEFFSKYCNIKSVGLYGSFVKGTNTEDSDIDLWILVDSEKNLPKITSDLLRRFYNVKPLYLTKQKLNLLKNEDKVFYYSLIFGSIVVYGDGIEAI